ncbi:polysaccharide biosynthesis protein [Macrococcus sp. DPC7161]|uniref:polysaccharide biosynthesis protein n=1 Tax=Macrococcus sp. DPC7161 TaxID=2507060 RepID=UPI00100BE498|nr:polysaccharide biosynthesis protein [Macrococcus sp. DPC7161]RXK17205.1 polysaccharide biosynthesis protein [Macrococcus sp. DPC7161]
MKKNKSAFNAVVLLTVTMLIVKILSAIYRVPYQNILGDTGLYAYQQVYPIVAIVSVLSLNAIPSAISQNHYQKQTIKRLWIFLQTTSIILLLCNILFSSIIAKLMGDAHLSSMLQIASLVLLPFPIVALMRGQLQKHHDMETIAKSQLIDQVVRVSTIMIAIVLFVHQGLTIYQSGAISIFGSMLGISSCLVYLAIKKVSIYPKLSAIGDTEPFRAALKGFITLSLFYSLSYLILILWQVVDSFTVINMLKRSMSLHDARIQKGIYDRGSSLIQIGLIVTTSFSLVLIPLLSESKQKCQFGLMNDYASSALKITIIFATAASVGLMNLMVPFNIFLFKGGEGSVSLVIYMLSIIFVSMIMMYTGMLQIYNRYRIQCIAVGLGLVVKIIMNVLLIPSLQINGASIATVSGLAVYAFVLQMQIQQLYTLKWRYFIVRWGLTLLLMSAIIQMVLLIPYSGRSGAFVIAMIGVIVGISVVVYAMIKMKIITAREWHHLPFGHVMIKLMRE